MVSLGNVESYRTELHTLLACPNMMIENPKSSMDHMWNDLRDSSPEITRWGSRQVRLANGEGKDFAFLIEKLASLSHLHDNDDIPMSDRLHGVAIGDKIVRFFKMTDDLIASSSWVINFLSLTSIPFYEDLFREVFVPTIKRLHSYTSNQYREHFGIVPSPTTLPPSGFFWKNRGPGLEDCFCPLYQLNPCLTPEALDSFSQTGSVANHLIDTV